MAAVSFSVASMPVTKVDVVLTVTYGPGKLGELRISKGGVDWWPAGSHTKKISHRWGAFATLLESVEPKSGVRVPQRAPRKRPKKVGTAPRR
jgi:hypothetical protein